jgi:hypothetical protein
VFQKILAMKICTVQNLVEWRARLLLNARVRKQKIVSLPEKKRRMCSRLIISSLSEKPLGQKTEDKRVTQWIMHLFCHNFLEHPV